MGAARLKLVGQVAAVALVAALLALLAWRVVQQESGQKIDQRLARGETPPAPEFDLERLDGRGSVSLASLRGKAVVVNFWASWCEPCKQEAKALDAAWREYRDDGLVVLGIDTRDFADDAKRFARENGMTYPLVRDVPAEVWTAYEGTGFPETLFVDRDGRLVCKRFRGRVDGDAETEREFHECIETALQS